MFNNLRRWIMSEIAKVAIAAARKEIADENLKKSIEVLKTKLREKARAQTIVDNIDREIADLEGAIEQGNV